MFENYPKRRPDLPEEFQNIYSEHYKNNREGKTSATFLSKTMERWMHKKVAKDVKGKVNLSTLEIGAGTLNQLAYETTKPYDIIEPFTELFNNSKFKPLIRDIYADIDEIDENKKYDRITSIATFEHITNLPLVVAKTCFLLNPNGTLRVAIPNEGTFLWKLGWKLTTGIEFRLKYGLNYETLLKYEHINTAREIEHILRYFYSKIKSASLGIHKRMAFYRFFECSIPKTENAKRYLKEST
ncbi:MAG TPA: class I SAM-dependent methyltransferase [Bacteroidaceae bacterium]|nr:class I SAM-dependent methyltransferase [Bacteroidaceae bacterium]